MACCFHLLRQWEDVLVYLSSIRSYLTEDDDFNWNFGIASAAGEQWGDAEEGLLAVRNEAYCGEHCYAMWLAKTHIMRGGVLLVRCPHGQASSDLRGPCGAWLYALPSDVPGQDAHNALYILVRWGGWPL